MCDSSRLPILTCLAMAAVRWATDGNPWPGWNAGRGIIIHQALSSQTERTPGVFRRAAVA